MEGTQFRNVAANKCLDMTKPCPAALCGVSVTRLPLRGHAKYDSTPSVMGSRVSVTTFQPQAAGNDLSATNSLL
jgi:hypothetical protein